VTQRLRTSALLLVTGLLTAGCNDAHIGSYGPVPAASAAPTPGDLSLPASPRGPDAAATAAAQSEADRLIGLVYPPSGSTVLTQAPADLIGPAEQPRVSNLVLADRVWSIPLSFADAQNWALAANPGGYTSDNTDFGSSSGPGTHLRLWRVYEAPQDARWFTDQLQLSISPDTTGLTYLRADAVVAAMDQQPIPDDAAGRRLRVTVAAPCPTEDADVVGVTNPGAADLDQVLVPAGSPTGGRLCTYGDREQMLQGNYELQYALTGDQTLDPAAAARWAAAAAAVSLAHPDNAVSNCPGSFGTAIVIALAYPGRPDVDLWQTNSGCAYVANGHIRAPFAIPDSTISPSPSPDATP
jgi:hypothetical protein